MALGVDDTPARRVVLKTALLTLGTLGFVVCLTLMYLSMRSVMDVGGSCASGGPYSINTPCPKGVAWVMPVSIFGGLLSAGIVFLGVFPQGGPRPYAFAWSALFLALGWNFLDYGFDPPGGGTSASWLVCGAIFFVMGGVPLIFLFSRSGARWAFWGPTEGSPERPVGRIRRARAVDREFTPRAGGGLVPPTTSSSSSSTPTPLFVPPPLPTPSPAPATSVETDVASADMVARLVRLAELHDRGALDDQEYEIAKNAVLHDEDDR